MKKLLPIIITIMLAGTLAAQDDRATFGLKGNITHVAPKQGDHSYGNPLDNYDLVFSETGKLLKLNGEDPGVVRDKKNRISKIYLDYDCGMGYDTIMYDDQGRVSQVSSFAYIEAGYNEETDQMEDGKYVSTGYTKYYYDADGKVIRALIFNPDNASSNTVNYTYKKADESGNWTERVANCPNLGLNNQVETRTMSYSKTADVVADEGPAMEEPQASTEDNELVPQQKQKRSFWDILFEILIGAALIFMIVYMGYILVFRDRNLIPMTVEASKTKRQAAGLPEESSNSENEEVMRLFQEAAQNLTTYKDAQGEIQETYTTKEQIEKLRFALVRCQEIAPTRMDCLELFNDMLAEYKTFTKRFFAGSKTYLIVGGIISVILVIMSGWQAVPFMLLNVAGYYFASKETQFMINAKELKGTSSRGRSKVMTAITAAAFGVLFSGTTYKTVTTWSDGSTTTDYDNDEHLIAFIIGMVILLFLAFFMFVVALINFIRNYLIYK